jgi:thioredoxin 1
MITNEAKPYMSLSEGDFQTEVSEGFVVVDFWAEWCGPCLAFAPVFEEVASEMANEKASAEERGTVKFAKLNVDENPSVAQKYGIMSIPTIVLFKDGEEVARQMGAMPKPMFKGWLESNLK